MQHDVVLVPVAANNSSAYGMYDLYQTLPQLNSYHNIQQSQPVVQQYQTLNPNLQFNPIQHQQQQSKFHTISIASLNILPPRNVYSSPITPSSLIPQASVNSFNAIRKNEPERSSSNGWGVEIHNHGWPSHGWGNQNSPAISALALLGFLFFLNLILNSLHRNRVMMMMLAAASSQPTTAPTTAASSAGLGKRRTKRDYLPVPLYSPTLTTTARPLTKLRNTEHIQWILDGDIRHNNVEEYIQQPSFHIPILPVAISKINTTPLRINKANIRNRRRRQNLRHNKTKRKKNNKLILPKNKRRRNKRRRRINRNRGTRNSPLKCFQLVVCNFARAIRAALGIPARSVTGRTGLGVLMPGFISRALSNGWYSHQTCINIYNQCGWGRRRPNRRRQRLKINRTRRRKINNKRKNQKKKKGSRT